MKRGARIFGIFLLLYLVLGFLFLQLSNSSLEGDISESLKIVYLVILWPAWLMVIPAWWGIFYVMIAMIFVFGIITGLIWMSFYINTRVFEKKKR